MTHHAARPPRTDAAPQPRTDAAPQPRTDAVRGHPRRRRAGSLRGPVAMIVALAALAIASPALAQRPALAGEKTFGVTGGEILVHYATIGADAVQPADRDSNGAPDFVDEVAATAEQALDHFL